MLHRHTYSLIHPFMILLFFSHSALHSLSHLFRCLSLYLSVALWFLMFLLLFISLYLPLSINNKSTVKYLSREINDINLLEELVWNRGFRYHDYHHLWNRGFVIMIIIICKLYLTFSHCELSIDIHIIFSCFFIKLKAWCTNEIFYVHMGIKRGEYYKRQRTGSSENLLNFLKKNLTVKTFMFLYRNVY